MKGLRQQNQSGVALVTTIIVVAVLAVVAVAFMQSTSTDRLSSRTVANYYRAQLAAKAGLADAMSLIQQGARDFTYVSGAEPDDDTYRTFIRPVNVVGGAWQFNGGPIYLDSGSGGGDVAKLLLTGSLDEPGLTRDATWKELPIDNPRPNEANRYAFWVDDVAGKQNLTWWGGGASRGVVTNLQDLNLALPVPGGGEPVPFPQAALSALAGLRSYTDYSFNLDGNAFVSRKADMKLLSVASLNFLAPAGLGVAMDRYYFTTVSASGATTPTGVRKINLGALARHVNNLSAAQGGNSPRATLVEELLKPDPSGAGSWGGGSFSWLATSGRYSVTEQKQIVANIIDYLDDDLIPTTDSTDQPTYFGVEMKLDGSGTVLGHPVINFLTVGLIFNRASAGANLGKINSTRVLCSVGLAYPWSSQANAPPAYQPEISISVEGDVVNGLAALGAKAGPYFLPTLGEQLAARPVTSFEPHSGYNFPQDVGIAGAASYATRFFGHSAGDWPDRLPANVQFNNVRFVINEFRLKYTPTDGSSPGYVFVLPKGLAIELEPPSISPGGGGGSFPVKFTGTAPAFDETENLYLNSDPRVHFLATSWTNLPSDTSFGTEIPEPADGVAEVDLSANAGGEGDGPQGVPMNFEWFKSASMRNHLARKSRTGMESIGEMGYVWTGRGWQTLNMIEPGNGAQADWNLLDYLTAGSVSGVPVLPLKPALAAGGGSGAGALLSSGGFNVNTRKVATAKAVLEDAPDVRQEAYNALAGAPAGAQASAFGSIAAAVDESPASFVTEPGTKFGKEALPRALANFAVNHSRIFTVYAAGEYRLGDSVSRAQIEADVFVGVDPADGSAIMQILDQRFK